MGSKKYKFFGVCKWCGKPFEYFSYKKGQKYCGSECRSHSNPDKGRGYVAFTWGAYALEADPWATGQLPESVLRNALYTNA